MVLLVALILCLAQSEESLRFSAAAEQETDRGCGPAAAASLLSLYCGIPAAEADILADIAAARGPGGEGSWARPVDGAPPRAPAEDAAAGVTLADLVTAIEGRGPRARPFLLGPGELAEALRSGYAPVLAHCLEGGPQGTGSGGGHFCLVLGAGRGAEEELLVIADPLLGLLVRGGREFGSRSSGAAILVDPGAVTAEGRVRLEAALAQALDRSALLEAIAPGGRAFGAGMRR